jgi:hypothetical protein
MLLLLLLLAGCCINAFFWSFHCDRKPRAQGGGKYLRDIEEPSHWPKKKDKTTSLLATSAGKVE